MHFIRQQGLLFLAFLVLCLSYQCKAHVNTAYQCTVSETGRMDAYQPVHSFSVTLSNEAFNLISTSLKTLPEDTPVDFSNTEHYQTYTGVIAPLLGKDYMALFANHMPESLVPDYFQPGNISTAVNSPLSYLKVFQQIGNQLEVLTSKHHHVDITALHSSQYTIQEKEKIQLLPFARVFPAIYSPFDSDEVTQLTQTLFRIIHTHYLQPAGFKMPVVFTGYVPEFVALDYVYLSLFADDPLVNGHVSHGKFPHLLTAAMLINRYPKLNHKWFYQLAHAQGWGVLIDSADISSNNENHTIHITCTDQTQSIQRAFRAATWPSGHNPVVITQLLMQHTFSQIIRTANKHTLTRQIILDNLGFSSMDPTLAHIILDHVANNILALENMVILDFNNDLDMLYQYRKHFDTQLSQEYVDEECEGITVPPEEMTQDSALWTVNKLSNKHSQCLGFLNIQQAMQNSLTRSDFKRTLLKGLLLINHDIQFFNDRVNRLLAPLRLRWLEDNNIPLLKSSDYYQVYRLDSFQPLSKADHCSIEEDK